MSVGKDRLEAVKILVTAASEPPGWNRISSCLVNLTKKTCLNGIQRNSESYMSDETEPESAGDHMDER